MTSRSRPAPRESREIAGHPSCPGAVPREVSGPRRTRFSRQPQSTRRRRQSPSRPTTCPSAGACPSPTWQPCARAGRAALSCACTVAQSATGSLTSRRTRSQPPSARPRAPRELQSPRDSGAGNHVRAHPCARERLRVLLPVRGTARVRTPARVLRSAPILPTVRGARGDPAQVAVQRLALSAGRCPDCGRVAAPERASRGAGGASPDRDTGSACPCVTESAQDVCCGGGRVSGRKRITLEGGSWVAVSRAYDDTNARNPALSTDVRLLAAMRSRLEPSGHAHFGRGELRLILAKLDASTGELKPLTPSALTRRIKALAGAGLLLDGSWSSCLVSPPFAMQTGERTAAKTACLARPGGRSQNLRP